MFFKKKNCELNIFSMFSLFSLFLKIENIFQKIGTKQTLSLKEKLFSILKNKENNENTLGSQFFFVPKNIENA